LVHNGIVGFLERVKSKSRRLPREALAMEMDPLYQKNLFK